MSTHIMSARWTPQDVEEEAGQGFRVCFCFLLVTDQECCNIQFLPLWLPAPSHRSCEFNEGQPELRAGTGHQNTGGDTEQWPAPDHLPCEHDPKTASLEWGRVPSISSPGQERSYLL